MKKIYFSITRVGKYPRTFKGYGCITNEDLIAYPDSKYERVFEDCIKYCHPLIGKPNQYKGTFSQFEEVEFKKRYNGYGNDVYSYETTELEVTYDIWFRIL